MTFVLILQFLLLVCIIILSYFLRQFLRFKFNKKYKSIRNENNDTQGKTLVWFEKILSSGKFEFINMRRIEDKLRKKGNPLNLKPIQYVLIKIFLPLITLILCSMSYNGFVTVILTIISFFIVDIINRFSNKDDIDKIRIDLANVYDMVTLQTMAGTHLGNVLPEAYSVCKNKRFRTSLIRLAANINLSKNIDRSLDKFNDEYDMIEINSFCSTIKQSLETGTVNEALEDQSEYIKNINTLYFRSKTRQIQVYIVIITFLLFVGVIGIIAFALGSQIIGSFKATFS